MRVLGFNRRGDATDGPNDLPNSECVDPKIRIPSLPLPLSLSLSRNGCNACCSHLTFPVSPFGAFWSLDIYVIETRAAAPVHGFRVATKDKEHSSEWCHLA